MNDIQKSILERRSNRGFSDQLLSDAEIQFLMDAALASPTANNFQDWNFRFVRNRELLREFSKEYLEILLAQISKGARATHESYDVFFNAPLVVFITLPSKPKSNFAQVDAGIAVENLAISAQGMGLGSVILGRPMDVFRGANAATWKQRLNFAQDHEFAVAIAIGYPTATKEAHPMQYEKIKFVD